MVVYRVLVVVLLLVVSGSLSQEELGSGDELLPLLSAVEPTASCDINGTATMCMTVSTATRSLITTTPIQSTPAVATTSMAVLEPTSFEFIVETEFLSLLPFTSSELPSPSTSLTPSPFIPSPPTPSPSFAAASTRDIPMATTATPLMTEEFVISSAIFGDFSSSQVLLLPLSTGAVMTSSNITMTSSNIAMTTSITAPFSTFEVFLEPTSTFPTTFLGSPDTSSVVPSTPVMSSAVGLNSDLFLMPFQSSELLILPLSTVFVAPPTLAETTAVFTRSTSVLELSAESDIFVSTQTSTEVFLEVTSVLQMPTPSSSIAEFFVVESSQVEFPFLTSGTSLGAESTSVGVVSLLTTPIFGSLQVSSTTVGFGIIETTPTFISPTEVDILVVTSVLPEPFTSIFGDVVSSIVMATTSVPPSSNVLGVSPSLVTNEPGGLTSVVLLMPFTSTQTTTPFLITPSTTIRTIVSVSTAGTAIDSLSTTVGTIVSPLTTVGTIGSPSTTVGTIDSPSTIIGSQSNVISPSPIESLEPVSFPRSEFTSSQSSLQTLQLSMATSQSLTSDIIAQPMTSDIIAQPMTSDIIAQPLTSDIIAPPSLLTSATVALILTSDLLLLPFSSASVPPLVTSSGLSSSVPPLVTSSGLSSSVPSVPPLVTSSGLTSSVLVSSPLPLTPTAVTTSSLRPLADSTIAVSPTGIEQAVSTTTDVVLLEPFSSPFDAVVSTIEGSIQTPIQLITSESAVTSTPPLSITAIPPFIEPTLTFIGTTLLPIEPTPTFIDTTPLLIEPTFVDTTLLPIEPSITEFSSLVSTAVVSSTLAPVSLRSVTTSSIASSVGVTVPFIEGATSTTAESSAAEFTSIIRPTSTILESFTLTPSSTEQAIPSLSLDASPVQPTPSPTDQSFEVSSPVASTELLSSRLLESSTLLLDTVAVVTSLPVVETLSSAEILSSSQSTSVTEPIATTKIKLLTSTADEIKVVPPTSPIFSPSQVPVVSSSVQSSLAVSSTPRVITAPSSSVVSEVLETTSSVSSSVGAFSSSVSSSDLLMLQTTVPSPLTTLTPSPLSTLTPSTCPSVTIPSVPASQFLDIVLGLISSEHAELSLPGSTRRCRLQLALAELVEELLVSNGGGGRRRRQSGLSLSAEVTSVGPLENGQSTLTFYIANTTDPEAPPTVVPAELVIQAFEQGRPQQIDSYPIIVQPVVHSTVVATGPPATNQLLIPIVAALGGAVVLLLAAIFLALCLTSVIHSKKKRDVEIQDLQLGQAGQFRETNELEFSDTAQSVGIQHGTPIVAKATRRSRVSISQISQAGPSAPSPSLQTDPVVPAALFERVAHYDSTPQSSTPVRPRKMRFRSSVVAPSPSTSQKSQKSPSTDERVLVPTPAALRPKPRPLSVEEAKKLREEALRLQEEREEAELKARRKATLERLMLQSRQRDGDLRSRTGSRRSRSKRKPLPPAGGGGADRPATIGGGAEHWGEGELEGLAGGELGDVEATSATPVSDLPASPQQTSRPSTKKRLLRRKANRIAPLPGTTDGYDSTDHRVPMSRQSRRFRTGRSQRGRPFSRLPSVGGGRASRGVAREVQQELAWMETGAGVQLMRIQPLLPSAPPPAQYSPHPSHPHPSHPHLVSVQPRPAMRPAWEKLPTISSLHSHSYTQRQLETYLKIHREMEEQLPLEHSSGVALPIRHTSSEATPTQQPDDTIATQQDEQPKQREEVDEPHPQSPVDKEGKPQGNSPQPAEDSPQQPTRQPSIPAPTHHAVPNLDSSMELMQQAFAPAQREPSLPLTLPDDYTAHMQLPQQPTAYTPAVAWHHPIPGQPLYAAPPPSHYQPYTLHQSPYPPQPDERQVVWAPDSHPMAPQLLTPAQLTHLRASPSLGRHDYSGYHDYNGYHDYSGHHDYGYDPWDSTPPRRHTRSRARY